MASLGGKRVLAFAGIGDPGRFFRTLRASGVEVVRERAFADHHPFSQGEIDALIAEAKRDALTLVTTEKDLARLRTAEGLPDWAQDIVPFAVTLEFDDAAQLRSFVTDRLFKAREKKFRPLRRVGKAQRATILALICQGRPGAGAFDHPATLQCRGKMPLQHRGGNGVGLLQIDAPVFEFVERYARIGHRAAHIGSRRDHAEIAIQILHLRFAMARGTEFIQHG